MKKLLLITLMLFALCAVAHATTVTVSSISIPDLHYPGSTFTMRIWVEIGFTDSAGVWHVAGPVGSNNVYRTVSCTLSGTTGTCPSFTIDSTLDSTDYPTARYNAWLYDEKSTKRDPWFEHFFVPPTTPTTWAYLRTTNRGARNVNRPDSYPTTAQVQNLIDIALGSLNDASDSVKGRTKLSVAPASPTNPIAVGKNDLATTSNAGVVTLAADGGTSAGTAVQGNDTRLVQSVQNVAAVFNVKKYGATGLGVADDTAAILAAEVARGANGGGKLYFPHGTYLISGSGAQIILATRSGTAEGEDKTTVLKIKSTVAAGVFALRYKPAVGNSEGFQVRNLMILAESGTPGAGIALDATDAYIARFKVSNVYVGQLGGPALSLTNPAHRTDGIFVGTVEDSVFIGDVLLDYVGDSINVIRNTFTGAGGVDVTLIGGAAQLDFSENNLTCDEGVTFHSGKNIRLHHNEAELQSASNTGTGGAMIYFQGDVGAILDASVEHNLFQGGGSAPSLNGIRFGNQSGSTIGDNTYSLPGGTVLLAVDTGVFFQTAPNHARGTSTTDISGAALYFYTPLVTVGASATETSGSSWITNVTATNLVSTSSATLTNISTGQQVTSSLATGSGLSPFSLQSTVKNTNLNSDLLDGTDWRAPGAIGGTTPGSGAFTTLSATGQITSTLSTGTAPISTSNTTPVAHLTTVPVTYNAGGTQQTDVHIVYDTVALVAGTATVTFSGSAVFTNTSSFNCVAKSQSGSNVQEVKNSGSSVTFNGTAAQQIDYICIGK
jgi:hypothetical protein